MILGKFVENHEEQTRLIYAAQDVARRFETFWLNDCTEEMWEELSTGSQKGLWLALKALYDL
jgi:hypothetical protein